MTKTREDEANDLIMGGGGASFAFDEIGDTVTGIILSLDPSQQTDFKTKEPQFWDDGRKKMQVRVALQTELTDWEGTKDPDERDDDDDGVRNVYLRYKSAEAVRKAVKAAGCKKLEVGGKLRLRFADTEKPRTRGAQPTKLYEARYKAPVDSIDEDDLDDAAGADERPAAKRRGSRAADDDDEPPAKSRGRSRKAADDDDDDEPATKPARGRSRRPAKDDDDDAAEPGF